MIVWYFVEFYLFNVKYFCGGIFLQCHYFSCGLELCRTASSLRESFYHLERRSTQDIILLSDWINYYKIY
ncbi:unnamed protein product [Phytomonas sp. Hart1]|nr:unnamed protein product [Phytomonas sp. Hart1]|eukprot:CCW68455.1 unnamed protein product [Phytomonas sp. isolate Hart1]